MFRKNTAGQFIHIQGVDATTGGIKSGVTWTVRRCLDGTFAAATGTATEDGTTGWYKFALSQADTNGNNCGFNFTGTGAVPQTVTIVTTACDPTTATNFGITALPAVASGSAGALLVDGTGTAAISNSSGKVLLQATQSGVTIPTVTTVTNQLTAAQIATGVWQDTTAGDFTAANSVGKSIMNGVTLGTGLTIVSVSGAVGSVTGAVGSVTGAVGSVTGNVGGNVVGSVGSVTGTVGSVTGNVGGNVVGSVGSLTTNNDKTGYSLTQAFPTNFSSLSITAAGLVSIQAPLKKNVALSKFLFLMTDATTHAPKTGLTIAMTIDKDGGGYSGTSNTATEIGNGIYSIDFVQAEMNATVIGVRATATGADDLNFTLLTTP